MRVRLLSGQVFSHYGGQRSRSPGIKNALSTASTHSSACEWYALAANIMQQQREVPADERISWRARGNIGGGMHRGSLGDSELRTRLGGDSELCGGIFQLLWFRVVSC